MSIARPLRTLSRSRIRVHGTVQGVGFRPHVYRLAERFALGGFVFNDARGVVIEVEGETPSIAEFLTRLQAEAPPLAVLEEMSAETIPTTGERGFEIRSSPRGELAEAPVAPDTATCPDCLNELFDPTDRRFRYPFINCTNCGPRFTIVTSIPYDRPFTTMESFSMCPSCRAEYDDPGNRRFHAQPNACPECGPSLVLRDADGQPSLSEDPLAMVARALGQGRIVAVKGIGGFHLACRADDEQAVARLRTRKHRHDKPFALMAASLESARRLVLLDSRGCRLLLSPERPIVLAPRRAGAPVARAVAPACTELGVMLPYSPLHHLLLADAGFDLVMTSGNVSDEPIAYRDEDALERLGGIADLFLLHDRPIHTRTDDSVVRPPSRLVPKRTTLRRSRGYVPGSLPLPGSGTPSSLLACGAQLKNTFCLAKRRRAWVSHHIGDLENFETLRSFTEGIEHLRRLFDVEPEVVAHDLHPEYLSTKYALEQEGVELIGVQHHHAHLAACLAEHGEDGPAVGAIYDGTGYGTDGTVWGGELLWGDVGGFSRVGHLAQVRLPGGAQAIRQPWRMACAWLAAAGDTEPGLPPSLAGRVAPQMWRSVARLAASGLRSPLTSSVGRLFDAVAAICGVCPEVSYEGQAAIELESASAAGSGTRYEIELTVRDRALVLDPVAMVAEIARDVRGGIPPATIGGAFHRALADVTVAACARLACGHRSELVILSGGVFANRRLLEETRSGLASAGLRVLIPERLPAGDGGISYGQAAVAARRIGSRL